MCPVHTTIGYQPCQSRGRRQGLVCSAALSEPLSKQRCLAIGAEHARCGGLRCRFPRAAGTGSAWAGQGRAGQGGERGLRAPGSPQSVHRAGTGTEGAKGGAAGGTGLVQPR